MWTAVSGAAAQAQNVEVVANNIANAETLGFKKDLNAFREYLTALERDPSGAPLPHGPILNRDLYPLDGRDQAYVVSEGTYTNFRQGALRVTQGPLDVAMDGPGFLEVNTPAGIRYTRQGNLKVAADGRLVTVEGYPVLAARPGGVDATTAENRTPASEAARFINLRDRGAHFTISAEGELRAGDELIAKLSVTEFKDLNAIRKVGASLFENKNPANLSGEPQKTIVRQGVLETSNVNPVEEMTNLIKANRLYEQDMKAIKTFGELMGREANDIGKL